MQPQQGYEGLNGWPAILGYWSCKPKRGERLLLGGWLHSAQTEVRTAELWCWKAPPLFLSSRSLCRSVLSVLCFPHDRHRKGTLAVFHMALIKYLPKATY